MGNNISYLDLKVMLKDVANAVKASNPNDKPLQRMVINDTLDYYLKNYELTPYKRRLLENYACKLQPK